MPLPPRALPALLGALLLWACAPQPATELPRAAAPSFDPPGGVYATALAVRISSATPGAVVHYTMDGSLATSLSAVYTDPLPVASAAIIQAVATAPGRATSEVSVATYAFGQPGGGGTPGHAAPLELTVTIQAGRGKITSTPTGIECGATAAGSFTACRAAFPVPATVELTFTPDGADGYAYYALSGSCTGANYPYASPASCSVSSATGGARLVAARFERTPGAHRFGDSLLHATAYRDWLDDVQRAYPCASCHGLNLLGAGIAPSCAACHRWPLAAVPIGAGFRAVGASTSHTAAVKTDGTLWTWGSNAWGQLGDGMGGAGGTPQRAVPAQVGGRFAAVAAGTYHGAAVKLDGELWAWGNNGYGQLGDGTRAERLRPVQIGAGFAAVAAGGNHTIALKGDGTLWAWGLNSDGQLGDGGTSEVRYAPVRIGDGFASVAAGAMHSVAVKVDGSLWAWGQNDWGQVGDGTGATGLGTTRAAPVRIGDGFAAAAAGSMHTVAVMTDGTLWAWGWNGRGQLGDGANAARTTPTQIGAGFASVAAGAMHTVAVKTDGTLWAWGRNDLGQLGDGTTTDRNTPVLIGAGFDRVGAGGAHTIAVKTDGTLWTWGDNGAGQLGDGTTTPRSTPTRVGAR